MVNQVSLKRGLYSAVGRIYKIHRKVASMVPLQFFGKDAFEAPLSEQEGVCRVYLLHKVVGGKIF